MERYLFSFIVMSLVLLFLGGCGNDRDAQQILNASNGNIVNPGQDNPPTVALIKLDVNPSDKKISAGETLQMTAIGTYSDMTASDVTGMVTWTSKGAEVASVDQHGKVTGVAPGKAAIEAAFGIAKAEARIAVDKKD